jgi:hypothetical protein
LLDDGKSKLKGLKNITNSEQGRFLKNLNILLVRRRKENLLGGIKTYKNDKKKPCLCNDISCTTTSYVGGGESPLFSDCFANPREFPLRVCCECRRVRLIVEVPLVMGAVGDIEVDAGNRGAVSALSWYGRLQAQKKLVKVLSMIPQIVAK